MACGPDHRDASDHGAAWPGMQVNISRFTGTFSNFNWAKDAPDFPTTQEVYDYLCHYAEHFNLFPYIKLNCRVIEIIPQNEKWLVRSQHHDEIHEDIFDCILIATNKFTHPYIPDFKGLENLNGNFCHSYDFKFPNAFSNKIVLDVGGSLSGASIAESLADITAVIHLFRRERWVIKRYRSSDPKNNGPLLPRDLLKTFAKGTVPYSKEAQYQALLQHCREQNEFPEWHMSPDSPLGFVVADTYFDKVRAGNLKPVKGEIDYFSSANTVVLKDGRTLDFDTVVFCTGYKGGLPFLPENLRLQPDTLLYDDTFPTDAKGIAYIGMYPGARGAVFPLVELQARLACAVFSGRISLPSKEMMQEEMANTPNERDEVAFANSLATKLGVLPDIRSFDLYLRHLLLDGAFISARFRLVGPKDQAALAENTIKEIHEYRNKLLKSKDSIPSLATLCLFKLKEHSNHQIDKTLTYGKTL